MSLDRTKAARVLALLASDQAGERDAAVLALGRLLTAAGMRFEDLAQGGGDTARLTMRLAEEIDKVVIWQARAQAASRINDQLRTTSQTWGKRAVQFERKAQDLEARLEISQDENAKLRAALGPERAAQAVLGHNGAIFDLRAAAAEGDEGGAA